VTKEQLLAESDVLSIHVVLSERTRGLIGASELQSMKPTAILVNTSRGPILDEDALLDTLRQKRISTAAIDVYDTEPLPADHPLRSLPNALLTEHIGYVTDDLYRTFLQDSVENIAAFRAGTPVRLMASGRREPLLAVMCSQRNAALTAELPTLGSKADYPRSEPFRRSSAARRDTAPAQRREMDHYRAPPNHVVE
jgi:uroporphyrinogen-III synthase